MTRKPTDLVASPLGLHQPLAEVLRPRTLAEVVGQQHVLGPGMPLRLAFESGRPHSCILWGPPGVGKTTIARLMADAFDAQFISISAVLGGVKDIREAVERAQAARDGLHAGSQGSLIHEPQRTLVFVDEVHRFNKAQQDAFLPAKLAQACRAIDFYQGQAIGIDTHAWQQELALRVAPLR